MRNRRTCLHHLHNPKSSSVSWMQSTNDSYTDVGSNLTEHVEVFPVALKLDYKPKRVDYQALKEGKTIELMNFFHFDGAEMTLRHITLSGVSSWFSRV